MERDIGKSKIKKAIDTIDRITLPVENAFAVVFFGAMCFIVMYGVICRFILKIPNPYGEEISRYLMIFAIYISVAIAARRKEHIRVDFLINALPGKLGMAVDVFGKLVSIAGYLLLAILSNEMMMKIMKTGQKAPSLRTPLWIIYIALVVGLGMAFIHSIESENESAEGDNK